MLHATTNGGRSEHYAYDAVGNRTSHTVNGATTTYSYDAAHQLTATVGPHGSTTITWDAAGRRRSEQHDQVETVYDYDARGRLIGLARHDPDGMHTSTRRWDAQDRLVGITTSTGGSATTTALWWDSRPQVSQIVSLERDGDTTDLVYGHARVLAVDADGPAALAHDHLGSALPTNATSTLVTADAYNAYGQPLTATVGGPEDHGQGSTNYHPV